MTTLYRKYRPQTFSSVFGQEYILQTLQNEIKRSTLAHAYLFYGPRGTGKTTLARLVSKAINCQNRAEDSSEPCDTCRSCTEIAAGRNIDVIEIDAASQTGVDNVRENIIENAQFKPTAGKYKIFIIDEVHMLSTSSFNALLKTLEEPPAHVLFILATTELQKLPATVVSRCERFHFKNIPYELMKACLTKIVTTEGVTVDEAVLDRIIQKSDGGLRDAESLLGQILSLNLKNITLADSELILPSSDTTKVLNCLEQLVNHDARNALELLQTLHAEGANLNQFALDLIELLHTLLLVQGLGSIELFTGRYTPETLESLLKLSSMITPASLVRLLDLTIKRRSEMKSAALPQIPLELLVVEFCTAPEVPTTAPTVRGLRTENPMKTPDTVVAKETPPPQPAPAPTIGEIPPVSTTHHVGQSLKSAFATITGQHSAPTTTLETVKKKWDELMNKVSETNHSLTFILKMSTIEKIDPEGLHLTVPYAFHREKIEEVKSRRVIEQAIEDIFGEKINLNSRVVPTGSPYAGDQTDANALTTLAAEFGGELVG